MRQFDDSIFADRDERAFLAPRGLLLVNQLSPEYVAVKPFRRRHVPDDDRDMRRALDSQRMFAPWRVRPSGLESRILRIVTRQCEFELPRCFSRMGPDRGG